MLCIFFLTGDNVHLKILVPSIAAGAIIGKGGETIAQVQKEAGARVKMSKANDFYPGITWICCIIMSVILTSTEVHVFYYKFALIYMALDVLGRGIYL